MRQEGLRSEPSWETLFLRHTCAPSSVLRLPQPPRRGRWGEGVRMLAPCSWPVHPCAQAGAPTPMPH